ncbi:microtubule associated protein-domain-containing protein [Chlamydoabsidia padenii]|nr:microtubule associated protein-domain-containing protein [Chlamydoabsidia padenii]
MERLQLKLARLETLWSSLGTSTDPLCNQDKLKNVVRELDKVLEYEEWQKQVLVGDIEDIMASIECGCQLLGISMENLDMDGNQNYDMVVPSYEWQRTLTMVNNKLDNEIRQRRLHIKEWLLNVGNLSQELGLVHSLPFYESYHDDLSWANMQKISCTMRDLTEKQQLNKIQFEQNCHSIHYYWHILGEPINVNDPIDIALHTLCDTITPDPAFDMNNPPMTKTDILDQKNALLYYRQPLPYPLSLQDDLMIILHTKAHDLSTLYNTRLSQFNHYVNSIRTLWEELKVPDDKRCTIHYSLNMDNLINLQKNFKEMKTIVRAMTDEYLETIWQDLVQLWDKCLLTQDERDEFMSALYDKANTMDTVHHIVDKHMSYLKHIQSSCHTVASIMKDRKDLIQKMIDFETSASDPKRLFQASFRLMEEERWRKTCFPTLLHLDDLLIKAVQEYERISEKHFMVGNKRYLDVLMDDISDRTTNQTFFGFLNTECNHDRPVRTKSRPSSLCNQSTTTRKTKTLSLPPSSPTQDDGTSKRHSHTLKQRASFTTTRGIHKDDPPIPLASKSTKQVRPSVSTSPKRLSDTTTRKRLCPAIPTTIIPQQCKSKSYPQRISTTAFITTEELPASPRPMIRSKTSQIPVRAQIIAEATPTSTQRRQSQQHPFTVQCA